MTHTTIVQRSIDNIQQQNSDAQSNANAQCSGAQHSLSFTNIITGATGQKTYPDVTAALLCVADVGVGNAIFRISLRSEETK